MNPLETRDDKEARVALKNGGERCALPRTPPRRMIALAMDWDTLRPELLALLKEHWLKAATSLLFLLVGTWWGRRRARREWAKKSFLDRLNFSLNTIHDGKLLIRTIAEMNCRDVFLNDVAVERVLEAAKQTTADNPILPLDKDERWYLLNAVLNELSERFAMGLMRRDAGLPVTLRNYLICLTHESAGDLRTRKVRAMIVSRATLTALPAEPPLFERPHHATRFKTLQQLAAAYAADPSNFLDIELAL